MKKKLVFFISDLTYGGAQRQLVALAKALEKNLFEVHVLYYYPNGPLERDLKDAKVKLTCIEKRGRWDLVGFYWRLVQHLKGISPDILHGYLFVPNLFSICLKPFFPSTKIIWGIRDSNNENYEDHRWLIFVLSLIEILLSHFVDLIIINSHAGAKYRLTKGFSADKMIVIPNGIDTKRFKPNQKARDTVRAEWGIARETVSIGLIGRVHPMKDHPTFLKAAEILCQQRQDVCFVSVGTGEENYLQKMYQLTEQLNLSNKVRWIGARADIPAVFNALDIAVSASAYGEGFSNAIGEAMACGVPCIVTDVGDSAWIVGDRGIVVQPQSPTALANAINELIETKNKTSKKDIRQAIVDQFSISQLAQKSQVAFEQLFNDELPKYDFYLQK